MKRSLLTAATLITVLGPGSSADAAVTYVDADLTNTTLADGTALTVGTDFLDLTSSGSVDNGDNKWDYRAFGNSDSVWSSNQGGAGEDAPALRVTISGLNPGEEINVFAYTWGSSGVSWRLRASLTDPGAGEVSEGWNTSHFNASSFSATAPVSNNITGSTDNLPVLSTDGGGDPGLENGGYFSVGTIESTEGNRALHQASLGTAVADSNGEVFVYIDDLANTSSSNRTFFDGVGYSIVPEPSSLALLGLGGLLIARRRRN
ncbi:MAG: PEP-CTERM sorting domain-containing protein [Planctomycetota bacterium]